MSKKNKISLDDAIDGSDLSDFISKSKPTQDGISEIELASSKEIIVEKITPSDTIEENKALVEKTIEVDPPARQTTASSDTSTINHPQKDAIQNNIKSKGKGNTKKAAGTFDFSLESIQTASGQKTVKLSVEAHKVLQELKAKAGIKIYSFVNEVIFKIGNKILDDIKDE